MQRLAQRTGIAQDRAGFIPEGHKNENKTKRQDI